MRLGHHGGRNTGEISTRRIQPAERLDIVWSRRRLGETERSPNTDEERAQEPEDGDDVEDEDADLDEDPSEL